MTKAIGMVKATPADTAMGITYFCFFFLHADEAGEQTFRVSSALQSIQ